MQQDQMVLIIIITKIRKERNIGMMKKEMKFIEKIQMARNIGIVRKVIIQYEQKSQMA